MTIAMALATAAPVIPIPRPKIRMGSRTMWAATPATWMYMDFFAAPSDLSRALKMKLTMYMGEHTMMGIP